MKKIAAILAAAGLALSMAACGVTVGSGPTTESGAMMPQAAPATGGALKVGVFYFAYSDTYSSSVRTALDGELEARGIVFQNFDANNNQTTQNEQIQTALTDGYNLLVVSITTSGSPDVSREILAMAGGVPVVFFNRPIEAEDGEGEVLGAYDSIAFVGTDAPVAGHIQGQMIGRYLLDHYDSVDLNGDGVISYAMMKGDEANIEAIYRTKCSQEDADAILTEAGKPALEYFDASNSAKYQVDLNGAWSAQAALDYMNTNLAQYNEANGNMIELIICNNDNMAEGCVSALEAAGYNTGDPADTVIPIFGVDATDAAQELIHAGKMTGTVKQDAAGMARAIADVVEKVGGGASMADAVSQAADGEEIFSVAEGCPNKLYVAYSRYTG